MVSCYGSKPYQSMTECRQRLWGVKTGKTTSAALKLCTLPPITEAFGQTALRAHLQISNWYAALEIHPPDLDPQEFGFKTDDTNKVWIPRALPSGVDEAPEYVLKLVKCGCESNTSCKGGNCGCNSRKTQCIVFYACNGGEDCYSPFKKHVAMSMDQSDSEDENNYG